MSNRGGRDRGRGRASPGGPASSSAPSPAYPSASAPSPAPAEPADTERSAVATPSKVPASVPSPAHAAGSSSSLAASLASEVHRKKPPSLLFQKRRQFGTAGRKVKVRANHFLLQAAEKELHQYDVSISPEVFGSTATNRDIISQLFKLYGESHMGNRLPAYDGMKSLYTAGPLPFHIKEFVINLPERERRAGPAIERKDREFQVYIKSVNRPDLSQLQQFILRKHRETPQEIIQVLDVVLRAALFQTWCVVGRSFFDPNTGHKGELGSGLEYWRGFYQSLRPTQIGLSLIIDVSASTFYEPVLVTEFVKKHFGYNDLSEGLLDCDCLKLKKNLKGVKVTMSHGSRRKYRITGVTSQPLSGLTFTLKDRQILVVQYYHEKYGINLTQVGLPALQSGNDSRPVYLPMELCTIVPGQSYTRKLNTEQVTNILRATCERPMERKSTIENVYVVRRNNYNGDRLVNKEFAIQVNEQMTLVDARVLPPPMLKYHDTTDTPEMGAWNMINKRMVNGANIRYWAFVSFAEVDPDFNLRFLNDLINMCSSLGIVFNPRPLIPVQSGLGKPIEGVLKDIHKSVQRLLGQSSEHLQLLIVILPSVNAKGSYHTIKRICETELGIVSQCCDPERAQKFNPQYFESLSLKINVKVGGTNSVLNDAILGKIPLVSDRPTVIIGADVTHPRAGEDSSPSIAAVVASMDWPEISKYRAHLSAQNHRQEIIDELFVQTQNEKGSVVYSGIIRKLLISFYKKTGKKPHRIIFYRDGVSDGQFSQVLLYEMDAIRKTCASLEEGYMPPVTFIVVQKRHHTRFFPDDNNTDGHGNILPGTVVDSKICHPTRYNFYLNSHASFQGTSCPTHYHVLFDENNFTADQLQTLTNNLCYTYARCTRSVSIVPPVFYAHLAASRACSYIEASVCRGSGGSAAQTLVLPDVHEVVKDVMFFC